MGSTYHSHALKPSGECWSWGYGTTGELGNGVTVHKSSPVLVVGGHHFVRVSPGHYHCLALSNAYYVYSWGDNGYGQLGNNSNTDSLVPVEIVGSHLFVQIAAGSYHSLALKDNGEVWVWGRNDYGQLGDNTTTSKSSPVLVIGSHLFDFISCGGNNSVALKSGGVAWAWGINDYGQLGDNTTASKSSPVAVVGGHTFQHVSVGSSFTVGLRTDGSAWAWGYNGSGQLGDNSKTHRSAPVAVVGGHVFMQVAAGGSHALGLKSDGSCWSWGANSYWQLGYSSSIIGKSSPVSVMGNHSFIQVFAGTSYCLALKDNGEVWAWGRNSIYGCLGDGTVSSKSSPVLVIGSHTFDTLPNLPYDEFSSSSSSSSSLSFSSSSRSSSSSSFSSSSESSSSSSSSSSSLSFSSSSSSRSSSSSSVSSSSSSLSNSSSSSSSSSSCVIDIFSNGTGGGDWSDASTWELGIIPMEGFRVIIRDTDTVTIDDAADATIVVGLDIGNAVDIYGTLIYPHTATVDHVLRCKGDLYIENDGTLQVGTSDNPIPIDRSFTIELNYSDSPATNKYRLYKDVDGNIIMHGAELNCIKTLLSVDREIGDEYIDVDDVIDWPSGYEAILGPKLGDYASTDVEVITLGSDSSDGLDCSTLTENHATGAVLGVISRNVVIKSYNPTYRGEIYLKGVRSGGDPPAREDGLVDFEWVEFDSIYRIYLYAVNSEYFNINFISYHDGYYGIYAWGGSRNYEYNCEGFVLYNNYDWGIEFEAYFTLTNFVSSGPSASISNHYHGIRLQDWDEYYGVVLELSDGYMFCHASGVRYDAGGYCAGTLYLHDIDITFCTRVGVTTGTPDNIKLHNVNINGVHNGYGSAIGMRVGDDDTFLKPICVQLENVVFGEHVVNDTDLDWYYDNSGTSAIIIGKNVSLLSSSMIPYSGKSKTVLISISNYVDAIQSGDNISGMHGGVICSNDVYGYDGISSDNKCVVLDPKYTDRYLLWKSETNWVGYTDSAKHGCYSFMIPVNTGDSVALSFYAKHEPAGSNPVAKIDAYGCGIDYNEDDIVAGDDWTENAYDFGIADSDGLVRVFIKAMDGASSGDILIDDVVLGSVVS